MFENVTAIRPGDMFRIGRTDYSIIDVLEEPTECANLSFRKVLKGGKREIGKGDFKVPLFRKSCLARDDEGADFMAHFYWSEATGLVSPDQIKEAVDGQIGDRIEPPGHTIYALEMIDPVSVRGKLYVCFLWRTESSVNYYGHWTQRESAAAQYVRNYLAEGTAIVLSSGVRYSVEAFLGAFGAFSTVFRATRISHGRLDVVLKIQHIDAACHEANVLKALSDSDNIVSLVDVGEISKYHNPRNPAQSNPFVGSISIPSDPFPCRTTLSCLVTHFVDGLTLEQLVEQTKVPVDRAVALTLELIDAVCYIHDSGFLHLDLKPQNIMVDDGGSLKIVDMGSVVEKGKPLIAIGVGPCAAPEVQEYYHNQSVGWILLSRLFRPFETCDLLAQLEVSQNALNRFSEATDVFSIGALFYSLLVGREPRHIRKRGSRVVEVAEILIPEEEEFAPEARRFIPVLYEVLAVEVSQRIQTCRDLRYSIMRANRTRR